MARFAVAVSLSLLVSAFVFAQDPDPASGILPFSTQAVGTYDSVDLATGNININIPVRSKAGKIPFVFSLVSNSHAYTVIADGAPQWAVSTGFRGTPFSGDLGYYVYSIIGQKQNCDGTPFYPLTLLSIVDATGAAHPLPRNTNVYPSGANGCPTSVTAGTTDGSGLAVSATYSGPDTIYDKAGNSLVVNNIGNPRTSTLTDPDETTMKNSFNTTTEMGTYTDTLGAVALSYTIGNVTGANDTYGYNDATGNPIATPFTVKYGTYTLKTDFLCSGIGDTGGAAYLPSSIVTPTGAQFVITYESQVSGTVTGRIASITYPSGGSVQYTYSGGNKGVNCTSGVVPTLTRKVNDNNGNSSTWTYVNTNANSPLECTPQSEDPCNFTVTETTPNGDTITHYFDADFETERDVSDANLGLLSKTVNCFNGNTSGCQQPSAPPPALIYQTDVYTSLGTSASNHVTTTYDTYGNVTSVISYDFGASLPSRQVFTSYGQSWNGTSCAAYASGTHINNTPCYSHTENASGDLAKTQITYSNTGHPTATSRWVSGSNYLATQATYATNGALTSVTDMNGAVTQYSNGPGVGACNGLFPVKTTDPTVGGVQLATSFAWDCNGGVMTSTTDVNNNTATTYKYVNSSNVADPLWRLLSTLRPDGGSTTTTYSTGTTLPWNIKTSTTLVGATSTTNQVNYDGLARPIATLLTSDPAGSDEVATTYDKMGRVASVTTPYRGSSTGATSYLYDALGRYTKITNPDSTSRTFTRTNRATEITDEIGTQTVQQIDGLGRLQYVCSGIGASGQANGAGPTPCTGVDGSPTPSGFLATYGYDALGDLLTVNYSGESRTYFYDGVSRLTKSADPESGTVQYTYDTSPDKPGDLYRRTLNSGKTITYSWDLLHRLTEKTYSDGTPAASYYYDQAEVEGLISIAYPYGRMTSALAQIPSGALIGSAFSYDPMGRVAEEWSCTPLRCPSQSSLNPISLQFTFDLAGDLTSLTNNADDSSWSAGVSWIYSYDNTPNLTEITTNAVSGYSPSPLFSHTTYGPSGNLLSALTGDSVNRSYGYDHAFRLNAINLSGGLIGAAQNWSVGYYGNNSVQSVADPVNGSWSYGYDKFNRLQTATCSGSCPYENTGQGLSFSYDQYANRWAQTVTQGQGLSGSFMFNTKNQITSASGVLYDADGNLTNDGNGNTFSFDPEGKLTASVVGDVSSTYVNDPFGHRAESVTSAGTFDYVYDPSGRLITEADTTCNPAGAPYYPCTDFVYIGASSIPFSQFSDWACCAAYATFNYYDYMGSLRETTSYLGLSLPYQNDPFGDNSSTAALPSWFGFGQMLTMGSGVQLSSTRGYHQIEARWLTPDPSGMAAVDPTNPQSWNQYAYVLNNPVSAVDPLGLFCVYVDDDGNITGTRPDDCDNVNDNGYYADVTGVDPNSVTVNADGSIGYYYSDPNNPDNGGAGVIADASVVPVSGSVDIGLPFDQATALLGQLGITPSTLENLLNTHSGKYNLRDRNPFCSAHVTLDRNSGQNGQPTTGSYHLDEYNPLTSVTFPSPLTSGGSLPVPLFPFHAASDYVPDVVNDTAGQTVLTPGRNSCGR